MGITYLFGTLALTVVAMSKPVKPKGFGGPAHLTLQVYPVKNIVFVPFGSLI